MLLRESACQELYGEALLESGASQIRAATV
jgi:hypothetical protein